VVTIIVVLVTMRIVIRWSVVTEIFLL